MPKVRLQISYIGTPFCGWQNQKNHVNKPSVQFLLEKALSSIYKETIHCIPSGRTDAGVHAQAQTVHFCTQSDPRRIPLLLALRTLLPSTISVEKAWMVPSHFFANGSAIAKTYRYTIWNGSTPHALRSPFSYWYPGPLHITRLQAMGQMTEGIHDFKTFQSAGGSPPKTSEREIFECSWRKADLNVFEFKIRGTGFLRQMVRNLVSTQIRLQSDPQGPERYLKLFELKDRTAIGKPAPAQGLMLESVEYPKSFEALSIPFGEKTGSV